MFSKEDVNIQVNLFNKYMNTSIPQIEKIVHYGEEYFSAKIDVSELQNNKHILHISSSLYKEDLNIQHSILWHEFVHILDFYNFKNSATDVRNILKTYSEAHATKIQMKYILNVPLEQRIFTRYSDLIPTIKVAKDTFDNSIYNANLFSWTFDIHVFDMMVTEFCYYCGLLTLTPNSIQMLTKSINAYPSEFKIELYVLGIAILNKNIDGCEIIYSKIIDKAQKLIIESSKIK